MIFSQTIVKAGLKNETCRRAAQESFTPLRRSARRAYAASLEFFAGQN
jgi:hypothetical protein